MADEIVQVATPPAGEPAPVAVVPAGSTPADKSSETKGPPEKGDSLDLALRAAYEKAEKKKADEKTGTAEPPRTEETDAEKAAKAAEKPIDKADDKKVEGEPDEAAKLEADKAGKPAKVGKESQAPNSWSAPAKAKFAALDPIIRNEINKRERDMTAGVEKLQNELRQIKPEYEALSQIYAPYRDTFARRGLAAPQVVHQLLALADHAEKDWVGFVREQTALRGLDLSQLLQAPPGGQEPLKVDPKVAALEQKVAGFESHLQSQRTAAEQQQRSQITAQVQSFQNDADDKGNLKHPHFDLVRAHMGGLMQADPDLTMDGAYERACWAHPEIREELQVKSLAQQDAARKAEAEKAANAAKSSVRGEAPNASQGARPAVDPKNLDATLRHFTAKAMGEGVRV